MESGSGSVQITIRPIRKPKRFRSAFTTEQIQYLEQQFKKFPYISSEHRKEISTALIMQERAIKIWFQNRRMKEKKESINKELDYVTANKVDSQDRLNTACTLSSANEQLSYSLPIIVKPVEMRTIHAMANTGSVNRGNRDLVKKKIQQVSQKLSKNHMNSPININQTSNIKAQLPTAPIRNVDLTQSGQFKDKVPPASFLNNDLTQRNSTQRESKNKNSLIYNKSTEFTSNLNKKLKKEINRIVHPEHKPKLQRKVPGHPTIYAKPRNFPEDLSSDKKRTTHGQTKQAKINGPAYYPMMPTFYAHPLMSSGGMIWKPMNVMPVMSPGTTIKIPSNLQESFGHEQKHNCSCNCHGNAQPFAVPANSISPYAQYVITTPFQNSSPKF